jgi:hypothetical protein
MSLYVGILAAPELERGPPLCVRETHTSVYTGVCFSSLEGDTPLSIASPLSRSCPDLAP